jgi:prohibitin 2
MRNITPQIPGIQNKLLRFALIGVAIVIALFVLVPFAIVPNGHRGVMLTFGKSADTPLTEGLHFRIPLVNTVYKMPVMIERSETESEAASRDLQRVNTTVVLNFHVDPTQVVTVYRSLGEFPNIEPRIIDPAVQESMKAVTAMYTAEQLVTKREEVAGKIRDEVNERVSRHGVIVDEFSITNFKFSDAFDAAIEAKTVAEQQKLKAERDLQRIEVEAKQTIEKARADAESQKLAAEAQARALELQRAAVTPELIRLREVEVQRLFAEKWDGKLPTMTGGAVPFINVAPNGAPVQR